MRVTYKPAADAEPAAVAEPGAVAEPAAVAVAAEPKLDRLAQADVLEAEAHEPEAAASQPS